MAKKLDAKKILEKHKEKEGLDEIRKVKPQKAQQIKKIISREVIGQDLAKENISVLISMHLFWEYQNPAGIVPPNGIIVGPTGSGKTFSIDAASRGLDIPFIVIDSTTLVPQGGRGDPVGGIPDTIQASAPGVDKCIVFLDEFDKLAFNDNDSNAWWKKDIQKGLLKVIENQWTRSRNRFPRALFFIGGAFANIEEKQNRRSPEVRRLLVDAPKTTLVADDFINYGFIPELVARMPAVIQFEQLSEEALKEILSHEISSPLIVWEKHFENMGIKVNFLDTFKDRVAKRAYSLGLGARGLQQIVFPALVRQAYSLEVGKSKEYSFGPDVLDYRI